MNIYLPDTFKSFVDEQVSQGRYGASSEYLRKLIQKDRCTCAASCSRVTVKPVVALELANRDIDDAIAHHISEGAEPAALGFIDALEQAYAHISRHPATGSPCHARELNLPSLRFWPPAHDRHHMFYV